MKSTRTRHGNSGRGSGADTRHRLDAGDIALAMVHGNPVMRDGKFLKADEAAIMRRAAAAARKIWDIGVERGILPAPTLMQ